MANELGLDILGTSFTIAADEDEAYLQKVLAQYRKAVENTQAISGINDPLNVAILTGFLLCDEINKMKRQMEEASIAVQNENGEAEKRTLNMIANLDQMLKTFGNE
jgi:cell division protein ZapA (FtsZ GTPase activity inhibitor)